MTRTCYDKEIPWHWDDGTNGLLALLLGMTNGQNHIAVEWHNTNHYDSIFQYGIIWYDINIMEYHQSLLLCYVIME